MSPPRNQGDEVRKKGVGKTILLVNSGETSFFGCWRGKGRRQKEEIAFQTRNAKREDKLEDEGPDQSLDETVSRPSWGENMRVLVGEMLEKGKGITLSWQRATHKLGGRYTDRHERKHGL